MFNNLLLMKRLKQLVILLALILLTCAFPVPIALILFAAWAAGHGGFLHIALWKLLGLRVK